MITRIDCGVSLMAGEDRVKVWDVAVRVFHWSLVVLFTVSYLSGEDDSMLHIYSGYGVIGLIVFRLFWGFAGTKYARFSDFVHGPKVTIEYARSLLSGKARHYLGHNPLGGWMVVALLLSLAGATWSGLEAYGAEGYGPLASKQPIFIKSAFAHGDKKHDDDREERESAVGEANSNGERDKENEGDEFWEETHEVFVNLSLLLVFLHIAGVLVSSALHRENLVKAMITGYKKSDNA